MNTVKRFLNQFKVYDCPGLTKIRLGNNGDGGYVALKEICAQTKKVYSCGIGDDVGFELDFVNNFPEVKIDLFDPTIDKLPEIHPNFTFKKCGFEQEFCLAEDIPDNSLLKMDIEHNEWETLDDLAMDERTIYKFSQILIEFHIVHVEPQAGLSPYFTKFYTDVLRLVNDALFTKYYNVLEELNEDYYIFHIHPNNSLPEVNLQGCSFPPLMEVSFVKKDLVKNAIEIQHKFPINGLDFPNKTDRPDIKDWFPLC